MTAHGVCVIVRVVVCMWWVCMCDYVNMYMCGVRGVCMTTWCVECGVRSV